MYPLEFLFNIATINLLFANISEEWANDFINRACSPLFYDILNRFNNSGKPLREILDSVTKTIILIDMPMLNYGLVLKNKKIAIKYFTFEKNSNKAYTFIIYLHELRYYFQRLNFTNLYEFSDNLSQQKFNENILRILKVENKWR